MRLRFALVALSLAANAALGILCWKWSNANAPAAPDETTPQPEIEQSTTPSIPLDKIWSALASEADDTHFVARLRAEGFPERVVRGLLDYRLNEKFIDEIRELSSRHQAPYWRNTAFVRSDLNPEAHNRLREIEQFVAEQKRLLLGPSADAFQPGDYGEHDRRRYGDLAPEKVAALKAIEKDYRELTDRINEDNQGITLAEDREKLAFLEKQKQDDIARLLTPDELEQYKLRSSASAHFARNKLQFLDPTEDEFLAIYRLHQDFDKTYGVSHLSREQSERRRSAEPEFESQIAALLGPQRYAEYQITNDHNFQETRSFITEAGLPPATARQLVALQRESIQQAASIKADTSLPAKIRDQKLAALRQAAFDKASGLLGQERAASFENYTAGRWLAQLAPAPVKPKP